MLQISSGPEPQPPLQMSETCAPALPPPPPISAFRQEETLLAQTLPAVQERLLQYIQERLQALELQITLEQQRQRDRLEAELEKLRQLLASTTQEQRHRQHTMAVMLNKTLDELRKDVSDALQRLSQDVDRAFRHSDVQTKSALDKLRDELLHIFFARDRSPTPQRLLGELLIKLGKQLQDTSVQGER